MGINLLLSTGPNRRAVSNKISGVHDAGILGNTFPVSDDNLIPNFCINIMNGWVSYTRVSSILHVTFGIDFFVTAKAK